MPSELGQFLTQCLFATVLCLFGGAVSIAGPVPGQEASPSVDLDVGRDGAHLVAPVTLEGETKKARFLIDTGSAITILDTRMRPVGAAHVDVRTLRTPGRSISVQLFLPPKASLANVPLDRIRAIAYLNLEPLREATGDEIVGILGMDFLRNFALEYDPDAGRLRLWKTAPKEWMQLPRLPLVDCNELFGVEVSLPGDRREALLVDTGAVSATLRTQVFDALSKEGTLHVAAPQEAVTAGGTALASTGYLTRMELGEHRLLGARTDRAAMSVIGLRQLSRFIVRLDFASHSLYLSKGKRFDLPECSATIGMAVIFQGKKIVVRSVDGDGPAAESGIRPGDVLVSINSRPAEEFDRHRLAEECTRQAGRVLDLQIHREQVTYAVRVITRRSYR